MRVTAIAVGVSVPTLLAWLVFGAGVILNPAVGALLMSLSTVIVSINATLLRRVSLT